MIKLKKEFVKGIINAISLEDLFPYLQKAIELEHATIPPYLTAMFSLTPNSEKEIRDIIHSIVIEEMMHMTIACNILNAIGGSPSINDPSFVPEYPSQLPMGIGDGLVVNLTGYSVDQVTNTFMEIEEPEHPIDFPKNVEAILPEFHTIGEFYEALKDKIIEIAPDQLPGDSNKQVTSTFFPSDELFPILTKQDVAKAIDVIVEQGEGTSTTPIDADGEIAHYYKFEELSVGKRLIKDDTAKNGYSFTGDDIPFDPNNVQPIFPNTKAKLIPAGTEERRRIDEFNSNYQSLLIGLHNTFNGNPDHLKNTLGLMFDLKLYAEKLCGTPFPGKDGFNIGPSFEFVKLPEELV